jgi:hypothetical protein
MIVQVVRTQADFERTLEADLCRVNHWIPAIAVPESAAIEAAIGRAFEEREREEEAGALSACLDDLAEPLERLHECGLQLVAMVSHRNAGSVPRSVLERNPVRLERTGGRARFEVDVADYLVAPDPCYFRRQGGDVLAPVHELGSPCPAGHDTIVGAERHERERTFEIWTSLEALWRDFELSVPWCPWCAPESAGPAPERGTRP